MLKSATCTSTATWLARSWACSRSAVKVSGTGPKAGGPLYLYRLLANRPENALGVTLARQDAEYPVDAQVKAVLTQPLDALIKWAENRPELHAIAQQYGELAQAGTQRLLPGPTGERNTDADAARACAVRGG